MADETTETCIVCLSDLPLSQADRPAGPDEDDPAGLADPAETANQENLAPGFATTASCGAQGTPTLPTQTRAGIPTAAVARLVPCGHQLHDDCLRPWVERANSCPVCRAAFNQVDVLSSFNGTKLSTYPVADKRQSVDPGSTGVATRPVLARVEEPGTAGSDSDIDILAWNHGCLECGSTEIHPLVFCGACNEPCHLFCAGLSEMPEQEWWCLECRGHATGMPVNSGHTGISRSLAGQIRTADMAWERVWHSVFHRLDLDLDFPFDESESTSGDSVVDGRNTSLEHWQRRIEIAARHGAASDFRPVTVSSEPTSRPDPESQEEIRAWNAFEMARALDGPSTVPEPNRRRRAGSDCLSDRTGPQQTERQLKRPRTRRTNEIGSVDKLVESGVADSGLAGPTDAVAHSSPRGSSGSFLQSLLDEVESCPTEEGFDGRLSRRLTWAFASEMPDRPGSSPGPTPPRSPIPLSSYVSPFSPPILFSPIPRGGRKGLVAGDACRILADGGVRTLAEDGAQSSLFPPSPPSPSPPFAPSPQSPTPPSPPAFGLAVEPAPVESVERAASPVLPFSTKSELQKMVSSVMRPMYRRKFISKDDYTAVNRDVSHRLYELVGEGGGPTALAESAARQQLQTRAEEEVAQMLGEKYESYIRATAD